MPLNSGVRRQGGSVASRHVMQNYDYSISLRVHHPSMDPSDATAEFGLQPIRQWQAGDARSTPTGRPLEGTYSGTYWCTDLCANVESSSEGLEAALLRHSSRLSPHQAFISHVLASGGKVELYVGVFGPASFGFEFEPSLLEKIAVMGLALSVEIYGAPQNK